MSVTVVLRVECDAFRGEKIKKKCAAHAEFDASNIRDARIAAEDGGWCFNTAGKIDKAFCPHCGPSKMPQCYAKVNR